MKKIGQGWQYTAYDLGNGRVFKKVNTRMQTFRQAFWYRFPRNIKRAYFVYGRMRILARASLDFLNPRIHALKKVTGNPIINIDYSYEQDLVTPVNVYFKKHTYDENVKIIDQYTDLIFLFWSHGFGDQPFKLPLNYGVTNNNELVLIDLGELYFTKEKALERIKSKHWHNTFFYFKKLKEYYVKKMDTIMTVDNLEKYWQSLY